jgi:hypothetical protein
VCVAVQNTVYTIDNTIYRVEFEIGGGMGCKIGELLVIA